MQHMNPHEKSESIITDKCEGKNTAFDDSLIRVSDEQVEIGYAMHPQYYWDMHTHDRHQFILMLDECSCAEFAWRVSDGSEEKRNLAGQYLCFIEKASRTRFDGMCPQRLCHCI